MVKNDSKVFVMVLVSLIIAVSIIYSCIVMFVPEYYYMDKLYAEWKQQYDYINTNHNKSEILFLGDSTMKAGIIPQLISDDAYNIALEGANPIVMYYALNTYLKNNTTPKLVIMSFITKHYRNISSYKDGALYYHWIQESDMLEVENNKGILMGYNSEQIHNNIKDAYMYFHKLPYVYLKTIINSKLLRKESYYNDYSMLEENSGYTTLGSISGCDELNQVYKDEPRFEVIPIVDFYMRKIIKLCNDNGIELIIESLPYSETNYDFIVDSGHLDGYKKYLKKLEIDTGVKVECNVPRYSNKLFGDTAHLNHNGAIEYSHYIKEKYKL